jgi:hypothetical protein
MILRPFLRLLTVPVAGLIASLGVVGSVRAGDPLPVAAPAGPFAAPAVVGCSNCPGGFLRNHQLNTRHRQPHVTQLAPGACFGYFQTQWHRWDDVCPIPYQGITPLPAPAAPPTIPIVPPMPMDAKGKGSDAPPPQPSKSSKVVLPPAAAPVKSAPAPLPIPAPLPPPPGYGARR